MFSQNNPLNLTELWSTIELHETDIEDALYMVQTCINMLKKKCIGIGGINIILRGINNKHFLFMPFIRQCFYRGPWSKTLGRWLEARQARPAKGFFGASKVFMCMDELLDLPYAPWCWNIYLHWEDFWVNVGKYSIHGAYGSGWWFWTCLVYFSRNSGKNMEYFFLIQNYWVSTNWRNRIFFRGVVQPPTRLIQDGAPVR